MKTVNSKTGKSNVVRSFVILAAFTLSAATAKAASGVAVTPFVFAGRIMDATHAAFDTNMVATVRAYNASASLLAQTTTFYRPDTRRNYALTIPLATSETKGYAMQGDQLTLVVTDDVGAEWGGVVTLDKSVVGSPGDVREIDIVLAKSTGRNGYGIDDDLYESLRYDWLRSDCYRKGESFDPTKDYDGDGVSTIDEAFAGTDPFDSDDSLRITRYVRNEHAGDELAFPARSRRAYVVESTTNLADKASWTAVDVVPTGAEKAQNVITFPSSSRESTPTVYLFPVSDTDRFYRVRLD